MTKIRIRPCDETCPYYGKDEKCEYEGCEIEIEDIEELQK